MKYNPPYGITDPNGPYINGDPSIGRAGSIPPAESIEFPQREIVNLITDVGMFTPDNADLHQLARSIQSNLLYSDDDAGTANQYQVTQTPAPQGYFPYMTVVLKIGNTNTGPSTLNVNALGAKPIVRIDGTDVRPGGLIAGSIVCLMFDGAKFQTVWSSSVGQGQTSGGVLTAPLTYYVNKTTGDDAAFDGTTAVPVAGTTHGPFKTIMKAVNTAYTYQPSAAYAITIQVADNTYFESVVSPSIPGPSIVLNGNSAAPQNVTIDSTGLGNTVSVNGPNIWTAQNLRIQNGTVNMAGFAANGAGASLSTQNTISNNVASWCFLGNGLGAINMGKHTWGGNSSYCMAAYRNGTINMAGGSTPMTINTPITVTDFAICVSGGQIEVPATGTPVFVGAGNVTGGKYFATLNGVINTQGAGASYFPGTVTGTLTQGGQYA
ncbi:hypothetical protein [Bradyrhizobium sp. USDA 313]|uniref:hypothetical protein n=1 Tax=Bradyrhizobium sp. USDA 313 TaxID=3156307 RepID=UPI0035179C4E